MVRRNTKKRRRKVSVWMQTKAMRSRIQKWISDGEKISLYRLVEEFGVANFSKSRKIAKSIYKKTTPNWGIPPTREIRLERNTTVGKNKETQKKEFEKLSPPSAENWGIPPTKEKHLLLGSTAVVDDEDKQKIELDKPSASSAESEAKSSASSAEIESESSESSAEQEAESSESSAEEEAESSESSAEQEAESSESSAEQEAESSSSEVEMYEVERIVRRKRRRGVWMYRVKWKGFGVRQNTWEPEENLTSCQEMLGQFLKNCTSRQRS